jgi:DNA-binding helix-hairpin-helix protein with protein kinase domain
MYAENELLFPPYVIAHLARARGETWRALVDRVTSLPADHAETLAFSLMMIRLDGCLSCETDSYRAMRGCAACALQTLHRFKGSEQDLLQRYQKALQDVQAYLMAHPLPAPFEVIQQAVAA